MVENHVAASPFDVIRIGGQDENHRDIIDVYANESGRYAVYQTRDRVVALLAEDPLVQRAQRQRLAAIATLRSQIDGDLADWRGRDTRFSRLPQTALQFDMRVASALVETLEGSPDTGIQILQRIQAEIDSEKASRARLSYLLWTFATAASVILICALIYRVIGSFTAFEAESAHSVLHAMVAGALGASYWIALGIDRRDIINDERRLDHMTDALVRICVGVLAAFILESFLLTGAIKLGFANGVELGPKGTGGTSWQVEMIAGFLAGFAERLVPDLLNSYTIKQREPDPPPKPDTKPKPQPPASVPAAGSSGAAGSAAASTSPADADTPEPSSPDDDEDCCTIGHTDESSATPDEMLPPASGGVASE